MDAARLHCRLIIPVLVAFTATVAEARRQCVSFPDPAENFQHADVVFAGPAVAGEPTGIKGDHVISHRATFRVERIWKGEPQREFTVGADEPFKVGSRYIVFAAGKPLSTTLQCKWSELESEAGKKREWLASKPSRRPR